MVVWRRWEGRADLSGRGGVAGGAEAATWDALARRAADANPFQAYAWGEYKGTFGWEPQRWVAEESGALVACMQVLMKRLPLGRWIGWAPGGPLIGMAAQVPAGVGAGILGADRVFHGEGLPQKRLERAPSLGDGRSILNGWIREFERVGGIYARFRCHIEDSPVLRAVLSGPCRVANRSMGSGVTLEMDLSPTLDVLRSGWTSKHRYYVKVAERAGMEWEAGNGPGHLEDFWRLYHEMGRSKAIADRLFDEPSVRELSRVFGPDCLILLGRRKGEVLTGCLVLRTGESAFYLMAATGAAGRKVSAAYAMIARLLGELKARGVRRLDFGGIDPDSPGGAGVEHFKRGFGGRTVRYLGEWEWSSSPFWGWGVDWMMRRRKGL